MIFEQFCKQYRILPNLKEHLLDVAAITKIISDSWVGELPCDQEDIIVAALLHDIGNMAKNTEEKLAQYLPKDELQNLDYWKSELHKFKSEYGDGDHQATEKMLSELKVKDSIREAISQKSFSNIIKNSRGDTSWLTKIISYSDLRINPDGICTLQARLDYIAERYKKYSERPDFKEMVTAANTLEEQIQEKVTIRLNLMNDAELKRLKDLLLKYKIA